MKKGFAMTFASVILCSMLTSLLPIECEAAAIVPADGNGYNPEEEAWATHIVTGKPVIHKYLITLCPDVPFHLTNVGDPANYVAARPCPNDEELATLKRDFNDTAAGGRWHIVQAVNEAPGEFQIVAYDAEKNQELRDFEVVFYANDPSFPPLGYGLQWIQFVYSNWPIVGPGEDDTIPQLQLDPMWWDDENPRNGIQGDERTFEDGLPFYYTGDQQRDNSDTYTRPDGDVCNWIRFMDEPFRPLTRPSVYFLAHLYLVAYNQQSRTIIFYDGIEWGFKICRVIIWKEPIVAFDVSGGVGGDKYPAYVDFNLTFQSGFDPVDVSNITVSPVELVPGELASIDLTVHNQGDFIEDVNVTIYADQNITVWGDEITAGTQIIEDLDVNESRAVTFSWNTATLPYGSYMIGANATTVYHWSDYSNIDNIFPVTLKLRGDINEDRVVNIIDISRIAMALGSWFKTPTDTHPRWNSRADVNPDGKVDILDIAPAAKNFGRKAG